MNRDSLTKFQDLLRTLFQFDCADLDFGIYRILNYKRSQVEAFITQRLPQIVNQAFDQYAEADRAQLEQELQQKREEIRQTLGKDAIDEHGQLRLVFYETPLGKDYLALREKQAQYQVTEELKTRVYNDLYTFFSRYYEDGDFISKRRYGRHETYAIPYNGEEVVLYWANRDQYYVKTGDRFKAYRFKVGGYTVSFELRNAAPERNGNTGKKRYFVLAGEAPITWDEEAKTLTIAFEYRPLTEAEEQEHGKTEQQKPQDSLNEAAEGKILERVADDNLRVALAKPEGANGSSLLAKHLTRFTRKNTADFFIHKDLQGFLRRELDFFLKNEVLLLDELIGGGEENLRQLVLLARVERQVAEAIIDFLAQVKDFQKKLWEKRKFVLRTEYCLTLDKILSIDDEAERNALLTAIAANDAQWKEWEELGFLRFAGSAGVSPVSPVSPVSVSPANPLSFQPPDLSTSADPPEPGAHVERKGWYSRGYLPHFDGEGVIQFVTFRLHDSVPAAQVERWKQELKWLEGLPADSKQAIELRKRIEKYEDQGHGACYLRDERIARLVQDTLLHFDGKRYRLLAWCIMPNHVHVLMQPLPGHQLSDILHSWKSFTAHKANKILNRSGSFWMPEYFDRFIRDERHLLATIRYIHENPVKAGLVATPEDWPWSSAGNATVSGYAGVLPATIYAGSAGYAGILPATVPPASATVPPADPLTCDARLAFLCGRGDPSVPSLVVDTRHFPED